MPAASPPSKSRADRAGQALRHWWIDGSADAMRAKTPLSEHGEVAVDYRATFQEPLKKVTVGVRQFVERESSAIIVGQRLKRMPQILNKLARFPSMRLSQMEDIGGCRAILPGGAAEVQGVLRRIRRNWQIALFRDYVKDPKITGYRAIHVIVLLEERLIEIQLRTPGQHDWAEAVERMGGRTGYNLKEGDGPDDLVEYLKLVARAICEHESGEDDQEFLRELRNMRDKVQHYWASKE
jgi:ppGpp synthetase/RelA/SpoT-type nucleotidyltranferase